MKRFLQMGLLKHKVQPDQFVYETWFVFHGWSLLRHIGTTNSSFFVYETYF
jgi:hypothetical protein